MTVSECQIPKSANAKILLIGLKRVPPGIENALEDAGRLHGSILEGCPARRTNAAKGSWVYLGRHRHAGARHRLYTALFCLVNGVLLQPLRFPQADRLVVLYENRAHFEYGSISYPNFLDWQRDNRSFQSLAAFRPDDFSLTGLGEPQGVKGMMVSANFVPTLGVNPALGRNLDPMVALRYE